MNDQSQERIAVSRRHTAELLDISIKGVDRLLERGELERIKIGAGRVAVTWRSLMKLLPAAAAE